MAYVEITSYYDETVWCGSATTCIRYFCDCGTYEHIRQESIRLKQDVSAASYFYAMCPVVGVPAKVCHVRWESLQGDTSFLHVLEQMGCRTEEEPDGMRDVSAKRKDPSGGEFDFSAFSDQALTLAAMACFASETVEITGIGHIRYQECDRFAAILTNLKAMGIACEQLDEYRIVIHPGKTAWM